MTDDVIRKVFYHLDKALDIVEKNNLSQWSNAYRGDLLCYARLLRRKLA